MAYTQSICPLIYIETGAMDNEMVDEGQTEMTENEPLSDDDDQDMQEVDPDAPFTFGQGMTRHSVASVKLKKWIANTYRKYDRG
jgi:hypothetical protein